MTSILLRAPKSPFVPATVERTLEKNLIGNNSGNLVFLYAAWKLLATQDADITPAGLVGVPDRAAEINERHDVYVVPLADAFRPSWKAQLERMAELIERLTIPVAILGVGARGGVSFNPDDLKPIEPVVKRFVAAVLDHGPSIGVRGETTATYLQGLGFRDVEVIGCPSMFLHGDRLPVAKQVERIGRDSKLAINIGHSTISPYLAVLGEFIDLQVRRHPHLVHFAQDRSTLELLVHGEMSARSQGLPHMPIDRAHPLLRPGRVRFYVEPWPWIADLAVFDFAFGTRIHGNIAALLAGTPAYVIAHDARTLELVRYFEIPHLPATELDLDMDAAELYERADYGPLVRGHAGRWERFAAYLARHGLVHSFNAADDAGTFDRRIAEIRFPGAITAPDAKERIRRGAMSAAARLRRARRGLARRARHVIGH